MSNEEIMRQIFLFLAFGSHGYQRLTMWIKMTQLTGLQICLLETVNGKEAASLF